MLTIDEIIAMKKQGQKVPDDVWKQLSPEDKKKIQKECGGKRPPQRNPWDAYAINEQLAKDLGSIPFNQISGVPRDVTVKGSLAAGTNFDGVATPVREASVALITEDYVPGRSKDRASGINMAALQMYTTIRRNNSGAKNYEAPDAMMYVLAMHDIYGEIMALKRDIGIIGLYSIVNHNLPDVLMEALGIDAADLRGNLANYRGQLNLLISKANAFAVPKYFRVVEIMDHRLSNLFMDSDSVMGQYYVFDKAGYFVWDATSSSSGTQLTYTRHEDGTFQDRLDVLSSQLEAMFTDDDVNTISGDILKAFGDVGVYQIAAVEDTYTVKPIFEEGILNTIENMIWDSHSAEAVNRNVTQSTSTGITHNPYVVAASATMPIGYLDKYILNSHKDSPDYRDILDWTRIHTIPDRVGANYEFEFGLEFVTGVTIFNRSTPAGTISRQTLTQIAIGTSAANARLAVPELEQFDWHPIRYSIVGATGGAIQSIKVAGDLKKFTWIDTTSLYAIDTAAIAALYWARNEMK